MRFSRNYWVTFTASGASLTSVNHELYVDDTVEFATTSALPTGLSADTKYYVVVDGLTENVFQVSATKGGDPIVTTGAGTGTQTFLKTNRARLSVNVENCR
jgi:hypothetical protein